MRGSGISGWGCGGLVAAVLALLPLVGVAQPRTSSEAPWSIVVGSYTDEAGAREATRAARIRYADLGLPLQLYASPNGTTRFRVALGRFASANAADDARRRYQGHLPTGAWIWSAAGAASVLDEPAPDAPVVAAEEPADVSEPPANVPAESPVTVPEPAEIDTTRDAGPLPPADSVAAPAGDPLPGDVPAERAPASGLTAPITFSATDSLVLIFEDDGDEGTLFGDAAVTYTDAELQAARVDILFEIDELRARGVEADTGVVGRPAFKQGDQTFTGQSLAYNLRTERGRIVEAQTAMPQGLGGGAGLGGAAGGGALGGLASGFSEGYIRGGVVKVVEDSTLYVQDGVYTTCSCVEDPSYSLRASRMKLKAGKWLYTGPIQLFLFSIPTPLWLPFGVLPTIPGRRSGPLPPQYGEDDRGFYLRDWGYYWAISDYMDLQVRAGIWTSGSWQIAPLYRYTKRYRYSGQLALDFSRIRLGLDTDPNPRREFSSSIRWNHSQTISPTASFSGNVNLSSRTYLQAVSQDYEDNVTQQVQSSVRYSKRWPTSGRQLNVSASQQQTISTGVASVTLPQLTFSQNQRKPFERDRRGPGEDIRWYERLTYSYNFNASNSYRFSPLPDDTLAARDPDLLDVSWFDALLSQEDYEAATGDDATRFDVTATHRIPITAPFTISRLPLLNTPFRLNVSPNASYTEEWFIETERRQLVEETVTIGDSTATRLREERVSVPGFFALREFSTGISANTTFYGQFPLSAGLYQGLRHTVRPSLSFSYRPDFFGDFWGYTRAFENARGEIQRYGIVNGVPDGEQRTLSLRIDNDFETKRVTTDSTGEASSRTVKLLDLQASTGYNFAADPGRQAWSDLNLSARTNILGEVSVRASSSFSFYAADTTFAPLLMNDAWYRPLRLENFRLSVNTSLQSRRSSSNSFGASPRAEFGEPLQPPGAVSDVPIRPALYRNGIGYVDFSVPWSLNLDATYSITRRADRTTRQAVLNTSFDFELTPRWRVQGRTGYDFAEMEVVTTNVGILRDFDCWQMSFSWVPFGRYQSYSFDLHVKTGPLRDILRLRQPRADVRGQFGGFGR